MGFFSSSSTTRSSVMDSTSTVDSDGFFESAGRAGGPQLYSLPGFSVNLGRQFVEENNLDPSYHWESDLWGATREKLKECGITEDPIELLVTGRESRVRTEPAPIPTILVIFKNHARSLPSNWREAARQIYAIYRPKFRGISVELINEELLRQPLCHPIPRSHPIKPKWEHICERILRDSDIRHWNSIGCWEYGPEREPNENPVTLIVGLLESANGSFTPSVQRIKDILFSEDINDVDILFMISERWTLPNNDFSLLAKSAYDRYIQPGVSIGIEQSSAGSSTLGGLVQIKFRGDDQWQIFGLTSFHSVYPPNEHRANLSGIEGSVQGASHSQIPGSSYTDLLTFSF
ncbi:unnamed protein product [Penicillium salamii]|nr:unnamed protein product [Penicillium salamii]